ncbi:hypothetical protein CY34DRAFT_26630 [Suillus luteus UH-Slu-Lm8-n1]|uniref:Uncharacterized protein n=1 Tax=Suillus luteus UH-Slu-Lm8-n1 TaxID=930992 RepID=A0A0C9ZCU4_9AGAM|nr:hypothetical protein CY34DRAFT_26630 [Suillus luteus UH-Slu-Lm8-n1]
MVKADDTLRNLTAEEQQEYIDKLNEHCTLHNMSVHATNTAVARDVQSTLDSIFKTLDALAIQTRIYVCLFASHGHMEADEITRKLEQWACMAGRSIDEHKTVQIMQYVCTYLLNSGLRTIVKRCDIRINYTNFGTAIKEKLGIDLKSWPEGISFQSPTSINDHNTLLKLCNALKNNSCHWFCMTPHK